MSDFCNPIERPVARKAHRCDVCNATIAVGTRYARWSGRYDGAWYSCAAHGPCLAAADEARSGYDDELMDVSEYNPDEALEVYHAAGVLAEALPYLREVIDLTDTELEGKDDAAVVAYYDEQAAKQLAKDLDRLARHFGYYGWSFDRLEPRLRKVARAQGLWKDGALTPEGEVVAARGRGMASASPLAGKAVRGA